jgi:hypothetical protein
MLSIVFLCLFKPLIRFFSVLMNLQMLSGLLLCIQILACTTKKSPDQDKWSTSTAKKVASDTVQQAETPVDTIVSSYANGKKLLVLVMEYHDSLPSRPIKKFEIRDGSTNELVFRSLSKVLALGDEIDPLKGSYDSIKVVPTYTISSQSPLKVDLSFRTRGSFMIGYLEDLTYRFHENGMTQFSFLQYSLAYHDKWSVMSGLGFKPFDCQLSEQELLDQFDALKRDGILDTEKGGELSRECFVCFLNSSNANYEKMLIEYKKSRYGGYYYYLYVTYLDEFIAKPIVL